MTTTHDPWTFYAGETWPIDVACKDADGNALDLTDASVEWRLDDTNNPQENVLVYTQADTEKCQIAPDGIVLITVPPTESNLPAGYYQDQLRITMSSGVVSIQAVGRIEVKAVLP